MLRVLDWPEIAEERDLEAMDRDTRHALAELGVNIDWDPDAWQSPESLIEQNERMLDQGGYEGAAP